ncbi:MAG: FliH/SctL family protein [Planctomycetota bacterium]
MITVRTARLSTARTARLTTAEAPVGARVVDASIDDLAADFERERVERTAAIAYARGRDDALREAGALLQAAAERLDAAREAAEETLSSDAVELAVEIARQLLKVEVDAAGYDLETIVRAALAAADVDRGHCVVRLHPSDAEAVSSVALREGTEIRSDEDVPRGSVQVQTPRGLLVRDPEAALDEIREQLLEDLV